MSFLVYFIFLEIDHTAYRFYVDNNYLYVSRQNFTGTVVSILSKLLFFLLFFVVFLPFLPFTPHLSLSSFSSLIVLPGGSTCPQILIKIVSHLEKYSYQLLDGKM